MNIGSMFGIFTYYKPWQRLLKVFSWLLFWSGFVTMFMKLDSSAGAAWFGVFVWLAILISLILYSPFYSGNLFKQKQRRSLFVKCLWIATWPGVLLGLYGVLLRLRLSLDRPTHEPLGDRAFLLIMLCAGWTLLTYGFLMTYTYQTPLGPKIEELVKESKNKNGNTPHSEVRL